MGKQWTQGKLTRMRADLNEIEQHLNNVAKIVDDESYAKNYKEAASILTTHLNRVRSMKGICSNLRQIVNKLSKPDVKAYQYAANLITDLIQEYCT